METLRVDISYRPLRIGFAVLSTDLPAIRKAMEYSHVQWGGRYNPIIAVDAPEAGQLVDVFRPDVLIAMGDDPAVKAFVARYPYLEPPWLNERLFYEPFRGQEGKAKFLDIQNLITHWHERPEWKQLVEEGFRVARWSEDDTMADVFLAQFGRFPDPLDVGIDYEKMFFDATTAIGVIIPSGAVVPGELLDHPGRSHIGRFGLEPDYLSESGWIYHGVYVGRPDVAVDLLNFWNLRACGISLMFVDLEAPDRTRELHPAYLERLRAGLAGREELLRSPAVWSRAETAEEAKALFDGAFTRCQVNHTIWNGLNLRPQRVRLGQESALGVVGGSATAPRVRFAMKDKPFASDTWFFRQHAVASVSFAGIRTDGTNYTLAPPCIPELNEWAARTMQVPLDGVRLETRGIGVVIDANDQDLNLAALPVSALFEQIFALAGLKASVSSGGLITRQLITRMGGVDGARAFKIPGVRRLLKTHGPSASFSKRGAVQLIGEQDPVTGANFADHRGLFIEPRPYAMDLNPTIVFGHLVQKGLFRIGADLACPACSLTSWTALDALHQQMVCPLCGNEFDATRQLVDGEYAYRRSGVLGLEKNTQGAVPVMLLLQQLAVNLSGILDDRLFGVSYDLRPNDATSGLPTCETDFCVIVPNRRNDRTALIIGECKDVGGTIDQNDVEHLRAVADAFPKDRFEVFILLAKLAPFTPAEIDLAKGLNSASWMRRVILLTDRELEPYHLFERTNAVLGLQFDGSSVNDLAAATHELYFKAPD